MECTYICKMLITLLLVLGPALSQPLNNTTGEDCTTENECVDGNICVELKCVDPCQGVCGLNTVCVVQDLLPLCSCKTGYKGDPIEGCKLTEVGECTQNSQCSLDKACINQRCLDPCEGGCGLNTNCRVVNHRPICTCLTEFVYSPAVGCKPVSVPECQKNFHCPENRACRLQRCVDPCEERVCGNNTLCHVKNHYPVCVCKLGFLGDALHECVPFCSNKDNNKIDNKTFTFSDVQLSWYDALEYCKALKMYLATINNEEEWNDLVQVAEGRANSFFWIGGNDLGRENTFHWVPTGNRLSYTKWEFNEPNGQGNHCLAVSRTLKWHSAPCTGQYNFACNK